ACEVESPQVRCQPNSGQTLALVATGLSNLEIADRMYLSPFTVRAHVQRAMTKLHARDRAQLVVIAYQTGLAPSEVTQREGTADVKPAIAERCSER
ncbi:response regulator transcription factor, partial [Nocardioides sp. Bht2]|uniref:response regulator transcription factor n=1 Tax=Nocardioides sp. Bht2 TaxID=3392297 RepID=UPI0039B4A7ED